MKRRVRIVVYSEWGNYQKRSKTECTSVLSLKFRNYVVFQGKNAKVTQKFSPSNGQPGVGISRNNFARGGKPFVSRARGTRGNLGTLYQSFARDKGPTLTHLLKSDIAGTIFPFRGFLTRIAEILERLVGSVFFFVFFFSHSQHA